MKGCPNCKDTTNLATTERILGAAECSVSSDGEIQHGGYTHVNWDSSETIGIECRACGWSYEFENIVDALIDVDDDEGEDED